ncbi:inositol-phosphate transport system permease protein [Paenibacillus sp. UNC496MF]|uniref:carbohydrate ABC transporter permease n=1 Tax=Paenibacillus sp. UNC496MF TaxID=1502753 RepID=UPI0008E131F7|nr:sugar ABC transporter permease [Paenibacillus sp. UNC496MF]SFJ40516.1 inositol-phosphate transport system permease protein [Paenibacillus sp. UNC496MF]
MNAKHNDTNKPFPRQQPGGLRDKLREHGASGLMLSPFLFNQFVLFAATAVIVTLIAFTSMDAALRWDFNGLTNFRKALIDPKVGLIIANTALFVVSTLVIQIAWGFVIAVTTTHYVRNRTVGSVFRTIWLLPRVSPGVVEALLWTWILSPSKYGVLNTLMHAWYGSEPVAWLDKYPLLINILLSGVMGSTLSMIVFSSALQAVDKSYFYVARVDGATEWSMLWKLIVPFLRWPLTFLAVWQGLGLLTSYESILLLTDGGPDNRSETWALYAFHTAFFTLDFGYGSAISLFILPIIVIAMVVSYRLFGFRKLMGGAR